MNDDILKNRQAKYYKNVANSFSERAENHKLEIRKRQIDNYLEKKRMKLIDNSFSLNDITGTGNNLNPESYLDFNELNINKEFSFSEVLDKLKSIITDNNNWDLNRDNSMLIENKIHILLFKLLEYYQAYVEYSHEQISLIFESVWALTNMVCISNSGIFPEIKKRSGMVVLKNYLYCNIDKIIDQVAICLGNIVVESNDFREIALKIGVLDRVVTIAKDASKSELLNSCVFLISNIFRGQPHPHLEKIAPSLNVISACLWKNDEEIVKICLWSISYISDGFENIQNTIISTGCVPKILEFVVMKKRELQMPSLRILGNLAGGSNKLSEKLLDCSVVKVVINLLNETSNDELIKELMWTLNNFSLGSIKVINYMIDNTKLNTCFKNLLMSGNDEIRFQIMSIYYNYSKKGDRSSIIKMINLDLVEDISNLISDFENLNTHTTIVSLGLLSKLIKIDITSERNYEIESKISKAIHETSLKEKMEYLLVNGEHQVMSELLQRNLGHIENLYRGNDIEIEMPIDSDSTQNVAQPIFEGGPNIENFKKAVHILYHGNHTDAKKKADQFLCQFERTNEAWDIAIQILSTSNLEEEAYYNASQIIKKKIRYDFGNFTENKEVIQNLAKFLIEKILDFKDHKLYLLTNFCKCLALLTVFAHHIIPDIIKIVVEKLTTKEIKNLMSLLLVFSYLAENINDSEIVIDQNYKTSYESFLQGISEDVILFLDYLIKTLADGKYKEDIIRSDPTMMSFFRLMNKNIVECFKNWIDLGLNPATYAKLETDLISVIDFVFKIDNENIETYSECICLLLRLPLQNVQMGSLGMIILNKVISFKDRVFQAIKIKDEEELNFFIDIFVNLCESNLNEILKENRVDLLLIIVELTKNCTSDRIDLICDFWHKFNFALSDLQLTIQDIISKYGNLIKEVIHGLIRLVKYDDNVFLELNQSKSKNLKDIHLYKETSTYRKNIKIFFNDTSSFYSFNYFYGEILLPAISSTVNEIKLNMNNISVWSSLEAEIFCFESICRNIDNKGDLSFLDTLFDTLFEIPENLLQIKKKVTDVIDEIGNTLSQRPNILMKAFNYLLAGVDNSLISKHCCISLKNLLADNRKVMYTHKNEFISIYNEKVKAKTLDNDAYRKILEGIVEVICVGEEETEIKLSLVQIMSTWVIYLSQAKSKLEVGELSKEEHDTLSKILDIIKLIVRSAHESLSSRHLCILTEIFTEIWPMLRVILQKYNNHYDIVEVLTQIIKHFMRAMGSDFKKYLEDYLTLVLEGYKINPISSYIYAFEVIATVFVNDSSVEEILKLMLKELCMQTFNFYLTTPEDFENNLHLTEDFFGLLYRIMRLNPLIILDFELFENIIYVAIQNIGISHPDSARNIIYLLDKIITFHDIPKMKNLDESVLGRYYEKVKSTILKFGEGLVSKIVNYILAVPPNIIFENLKDLTKDLIENYKNECMMWFEKSLVLLPQDCLTNSEKEKFVKTIINYNDNIMDDILENFYRRCLSRLYRQT